MYFVADGIVYVLGRIYERRTEINVWLYAPAGHPRLAAGHLNKKILV
jgi:hypothetical protein